jgi:hypothetical protein
MRELLRRGRASLVIGVCALGVSLAAGNLVGRFFSNHIAEILQEGLLIGGWVAMWRPMEIFDHLLRPPRILSTAHQENDPWETRVPVSTSP